MRELVFKAIEDRNARACKRRAGLTMLEVIFAMMVILIGLVAVGLLIPLAGRQAADSYQITQGLAAGESAARMLDEGKGFQPSLERPWSVVDGTNPPLHMASLDEYYNSVSSLLAGGSSSVATQEDAALIQNTSIGDGFCLDPLFWGSQPLAYTPPPQSALVREVFPFWQKDRIPFTLTPCDPVPRLRRVSFLNVNGIATNKTWIPQAAATRVASMFGGDLVQGSVTNRASPPIRGFYLSSDAALITSPPSSENPTWMMTMTPADTIPVIPTGLVNNSGSNGWSVAPVFKPRIFDVSVVVFAKRDAGEITTQSFQADWSNNLPRSERPMSVTYISPEAVNSGSFELDLNSPSSFDTTYRVKVGNWLMLSRMSYRDLVPRHIRGTPFLRQVHRWYRVVSVEGDGIPPVRVRVVGKPWGPTDGEQDDFRIHRRPYQLFPSPANPFVHAVVLQDVVQVYEKQITID